MYEPLNRTRSLTFRAILAFFLLNVLSPSMLAQPAGNADVQLNNEQLNSLLSQAADTEDALTRQNILTSVLDLVEEQIRTELAGHHDGMIEFPTDPITPSSVAPDTAIIYSIPQQERLLHLVLHDSVIRSYQVDITKERFDRAIRYYGEELQISTSFGGMERASIELYGWLVQPYVSDLKINNIDKILFVGLPNSSPPALATLFDGQNYLVDEFAVGSSIGLLQTSSESTQESAGGVMAKVMAAFYQKHGQRLELTQIQNETGTNIILSASKITSRDNSALLELNSAYLAVGADTGIVSNWSISDTAHAIFMAAFTATLNSGASKVEALRFAQLELKSTPRFSHPYFWSALRLVGNWQ